MLRGSLRTVILTELNDVLVERASADPEQSYTARLLSDNALSRRKIMEEAFEVCLELEQTEIRRDELANEAADLIYHLMVGLVGAGVSIEDVLKVLEQRRS